MELYRSIGKRLLDLAIAVPLTLLAAPLLVGAAIAVRITSPGPVLFRQRRLGRDGETFEIFKLRTMTHRDQARQPTDEVAAGDPDVTVTGRLLRRTKLDELPQLLNVIRGDMSLVGPRPPLPSQLTQYDERSRLRLTVRPGITGLAQVNGNIVIPWPERWKWDVEYVEQLSLGLDVRILARTVGIVLHGDRRGAPGAAA